MTANRTTPSTTRAGAARARTAGSSYGRPHAHAEEEGGPSEHHRHNQKPCRNACPNRMRHAHAEDARQAPGIVADHGPYPPKLKTGGKAAVDAHAHSAHVPQHRNEQTSRHDDQGKQKGNRAKQHERPAASQAARRARPRHDGPRKFDRPRNKHAHRDYDQREEPSAVQPAVLVAQHARRKRRMHVPGDVARPPERVTDTTIKPNTGTSPTSDKSASFPNQPGEFLTSSQTVRRYPLCTANPFLPNFRFVHLTRARRSFDNPLPSCQRPERKRARCEAAGSEPRSIEREAT